MSARKEVHSGKNPKIVLEHYTNDEKRIISELSKFFYVTNGGENIQSGGSTYRYCLLKFPTDRFELFGVDFEVICLFSPFDNFEPRTLDSIDIVENKISGFRLDKICAFVISKCDSFLEKLNSVMKSNKESRVIIPFTYKELLSNCDDRFINERIQDYFFQRDLFDFQAALTKELYFFGRDQVVHNLVDKHIQGESSGIFGLRKSGKTSILHAVRRTLKQKDFYSVIIDCQLLYQGRWFDALFSVANEINIKLFTKVAIDKKSYIENLAKDSFERDIKKIYNKLQKRVLIIFDEIEHLTYGSSANPAWGKDKDYLYFWNIIRALFQKTDSCFTFLISGTNPSCVEISKIETTDNPLFQQFKPIYLSGFCVEDTKQMVSTLSKYMCIKFSEEVYTYLTDDFGGHPFLIRQACSFLCQEIKRGNGKEVDKLFYKHKISEFESDNYCKMIVDVLNDSYKDEYVMLEYLAQGDIDDFNELANSDSNYVRHLLGYSIIAKSGMNNYQFNIPIIKTYLIRKNKYQRLNLTVQEKYSELSERRNNLEIKLRDFIKKRIIEEFGRKSAILKVSIILGVKESDLKCLNYDDLFDPKKNKNLYFSSLVKLITQDQDVWKECFEEVFINKKDIERKLSFLNDINVGRADTHAVGIDESDMKIARGCFEGIENIIFKQP